MDQVTVSEEALRELVREALDNKRIGAVLVPESTVAPEEPVKVNDVVDPSAAVTDPGNPDFRPHSRAELQVAVKALSDDLPDEKVPDVYEKLVGALEVSQDKDDDGDKKMKTKDTKAEAAVRRAIRKQIQGNLDLTEAFPKKEKKLGPVVGPLPPVKKIPPGVHGAEYMRKIEKGKKDLKATLKAEPLDDVDDVEGEEAPEKRKFSTMTDVEGASFQEIAKELGFSVAGAKQAVDKALQKAQWVGQMQEEAPEDFEIIVLMAMNDYIKFLSKSGELSSADVQLMKDHPDIVRELDGFREFLDKAIRKARKGGAVENPLGESRKVIKKGRLTIVLEKSEGTNRPKGRSSRLREGTNLFDQASEMLQLFCRGKGYWENVMTPMEKAGCTEDDINRVVQAATGGGPNCAVDAMDELKAAFDRAGR